MTEQVITEQAPIAGQLIIECKGIRPTTDFPKSLQGLTSDQIAHHYGALRNSHKSLAQARGQLQRRSRDFIEARNRLLETLQNYEERLIIIGKDKADALLMAQELHREIVQFEAKQKKLDQLIDELDETKKTGGYWAIFNIQNLIDQMRNLLRGDDSKKLSN